MPQTVIHQARRAARAATRVGSEYSACGRVLARHALHWTGLMSPRPKVFAIGFNKTGTSSLHDVFTQLDLHSNHGERWRDSRNPWYHLAWDAYSDGIPTDFRALDARYPNARFILQARDLSSWLASSLNHIEREPAETLQRTSDDWVVSDEAVMKWIVDRNRHHGEVMAHFSGRPTDLLILNFIRDQEAANQLIEFLGGKTSFEKPHANPNPTSGSGNKHTERIERCLAALGVPPDDWSNDLLCRMPAMPEHHRALPIDTRELQAGE